VEVYSDTKTASAALGDKFIEAYKQEAAAKGSLTIAIPSGSVVSALGKLAGTKEVDWTKVHVFFCNGAAKKRKKCICGRRARDAAADPRPRHERPFPLRWLTASPTPPLCVGARRARRGEDVQGRSG
jgi:hypothetical protein